ncbi:MAG: M36 family metallopeptidase [Actinomycetota bacterium]|nr:M36 family metallopeptidase [Actinomycetota bacterium]
MRVSTSRRVLAILLASALVVPAIIAAAPASADTPIPSVQGWSTGGLPDLDVRSEGAKAQPSAEQKALLRQLGDDIEVGWTELAVPHSLRARTGPLTSPSDAGPIDTARSFLRSYAVLFRQTPSDIDALKITMNHKLNGITYLRYKQAHGGQDVHGSSLLVVLDAKNRIWMVGGNLAPSLGPPLPPVLGAAGAVAKVAENVSPRDAIAVPHQIRAGTFRNDFALPDLRRARPVTTELVTVPTAVGGNTAWRVLMHVASNVEYEVLVDATTGKILYRRNQISSSEPHGLVHTGDDPEAGGQVPNVLFSGIDGTWVAADTTSGNNTDTFQDLFDDNAPAAADRPVAADQHFDYTWTDPWGTSSTIPDSGADRDAVVTQLFYYTNWFHDYAYNLGFTETARNFQEDNFGRGGTGGDAVWATSDDGYGTGTEMLCLNSSNQAILCRNNANFTTGGADGSRPVMQMYVGDDGRRTQRANNRDTVIHEYVHGVTGRIISDTNLQGGVQSGALGEGWSDAFATSINNDPVYGEYNNGDYDDGIRGVAYNEDSLEYGDLCTQHPDGCQVHTDGRIWAMAMWEERAALIAKHGFDDGKSLHEELMMGGLFVTPDTPSYHDARTGYLVADALRDLFGDPDAGNQCLIWRVFADNELGVTAAPDADDDSTPTVSTDTPDGCAPEAVIAEPATTPEGSPVSLDGSTSIVNGDDGDTLAYAWDLDDDGDYDDSTSATPTVTFGDNGIFTVSLQVTNTAGYSDTVDATVTTTNVAPTVTIAPDQITSRDENQSLSVTANFTDPGWLDTYTSSIDPGTTDITGTAGTVVIGDEGPPANVGTVTGTLTYGDNGAFTVTVSLTDDDLGKDSDSFEVNVANLDPQITIDETDTVDVNGVSTFFADIGELVEIPADVEDEGSDDETVTWDWDDGAISSLLFRNDPSFDDPVLSPTVNPRDFVTAASHLWVNACMYDVGLEAVDDDAGTDSDSVKVLITAPPSLTREAGYWQHQYKGNGRIDFSNAQLECYLEITAFLSNLFNEERDASTRQIAHDDIFVAGKRGSAREQLDREILTAWLNFANGGVEYTEMLDTDGNFVGDTSFVDVMTQAESVRLDPLSTRSDLLAQKNLLAQINGRDGL